MPWPNLPDRAALGEGVYSWGRIEDALGYQARWANRGVSTEVMEFSVRNRDLANFRRLDIDSLPDPEAWMTRFSRLWGGVPDHGLDYITRQTAIGMEHFFGSSVFSKLRF